MSRIVIVGGHGKIALRLARILSSQGHHVTSLIRNPQHSGDVEATGATPAVADVEHLSTEEIAEAIASHDAVVWSAGAGGGSPERTYAVDRDAAIRSIDAAAEAGVDRYLMISYLGAGHDHGLAESDSFYPYAESKAEADDHLRRSTLTWTILGPSTLTLDAATGKIEVGTDLEPGRVSRDDVAQVAAVALESPATIGKFVGFNSGDVPIEEALRSA
ncbi:SDR family oxidoreductase [Saxibacter everestensis]|uniref:SDR family oxidoreductase n=1 Tax=Saxibacter everestensis TaxID=2909229 RepID=A0ABY8QT15_9MICO|nr:SDR family oxidoreductase [Brevibacteriaceae bacterium ZFBP1038]